ncbi:MAG: extracellular solute-binding protein [Provencibacterium sp.]|jgi:putative aldouronate transport system substrate-binding protein|nr:extracellular solute-binding protein [Provencibacterium sp.]
MKNGKILPLLLAGAMSLSALAGCSSSDAPASSAPASSAPSGSAAPASSAAAGSAASSEDAAPAAEGVSYPIVTDNSVTLSYWMEINGSASKYISSYAENTAWQEIQKKTGVNIEFIHPAIGQVKEQFNLLMVSGNLPDLLANAENYKGGEFQGMIDGFFMDVTGLLPQYAPDYWSYIQNDEEFFREVSNEEGRICSFYAYKPYGDPPFQRIILRQDVLDELGKEIPKTIADYEELFDAMLAAGITPYMLAKNGYEIQFEGPFNVAAQANTFFKNEEGKVVFGQVEPGFKDYLAKMNEWYQKGYISKDFTSVDNNQIQTLFDTKKLGTFTGAIVANFNRASTQGFEVTSAPYPRMEEGQQLHHESTNIWPLQGRGSMMAVITKDCKQPEIAAQFLNYGYTQEGADLMNWGVEGINYEVVNGEKVYNDLMLNNEKFGTEEASYIYKLHFAPKATEFDVVCHANLLKSPDSLASRFKWADDDKVDSEYQLPPFQLTTDEQTKKTKLMTEINTYTDEMVLKFITGAESLDRFDEFVAAIKGMGLDEVLQIQQTAYDRYMQKKLG